MLEEGRGSEVSFQNSREKAAGMQTLSLERASLVQIFLFFQDMITAPFFMWTHSYLLNAHRGTRHDYKEEGVVLAFQSFGNPPTWPESHEESRMLASGDQLHKKARNSSLSS